MLDNELTADEIRAKLVRLRTCFTLAERVSTKYYYLYEIDKYERMLSKLESINVLPL